MRSTVDRAPTGLAYALCALSHYRHRHVYKEAGTRKGFMRNHRIKDLSRSGEQRWACRQAIRDARALGFRGSAVRQVLNKLKTKETACNIS